jgi:hypothetical protein
MSPGPTDTVFYLSGSKAEGIAAFTSATTTYSYTANHFLNDPTTAINGTLAATVTLQPNSGLGSKLPVGSSSVSISAFIRMPNSPFINVLAIAEWGSISGTTDNTYSLRIVSDSSTKSAILQAAGGSSALLTAPTSSSLNDNKWHHVAITSSSSSTSLYVDGSVVATSARTLNTVISSTVSSTLTISKSFPVNACPTGWVASSANTCYKFFGGSRNWQDTKNFCATQGTNGNSFSFRNQFDYDAITPLLGGNTVWVSLKYSGSWVFDRPGVSTSFANSKWAGGEPNGNQYEPCSQMYAQGVMNDIPCGYGYAALCEIDGNVATVAPTIFMSFSDIRIFARELSSSEVVTLAQPPLATIANNSLTIAPIPCKGCTSYGFVCKAGYYGSTNFYIQSAITGIWNWTRPHTCLSCPSNTYSYGGSATCSSCSSKSTFISSSLGCQPTSYTGLTDTSFYLSGLKTEGVAAFNMTSDFIYTSDRLMQSETAINGTLAATVTLQPNSGLGSKLPVGSSSVSISAFIRMPNSPFINVLAIAEWGSISGTTDNTYSLRIVSDSSTKTAILQAAGGSSALLTAPTSSSLNDNKWHHVAITSSSSSTSLYVDGSVVATSARTLNTVISSTVSSTLTISKSFPVDACPTGWVASSANTCYKFFSGGRTWQQGKDFCATQGTNGNNFAYRNQIDYDAVVSLLGGNEVWVSLKYTGSWVFDRPGVSTTFANTKWNGGEPNGNWGEPCATMYASGKMNDWTCNNGLPIVCEIDAAPSFKGTFFMSLSDVRIFSRSLTSTEIQTLSRPALDIFSNSVPKFSTSLIKWPCSAGYFGNISALARIDSTNEWYFVNKSASLVGCSTCRAGSWSSEDSTRCTLCAAGLYGDKDALTTSSCSGSCSAGFYCPIGSTQAMQVSCGSVDLVCPTGSGSPTTVLSGFYSSPLTNPPSQRSLSVACPVSRYCNGGILYPSIDISSSCPSGTLTADLLDDQKSSNFGSVLKAVTLGWSSPTVLWSFVNMTAANPTLCPISSSGIRFSSELSNTTFLAIGATPINAVACSAGFNLLVRAKRYPETSSDSIYSDLSTRLYDTCSINVYPAVALRPPIITLCKKSITVSERQAPGTEFGSIVAAKSLTATSTIVYVINASTSSPNTNVPLPFGIDCNGTLFATRTALYSLASSYNVSIRIDNIGYDAIASTVCNVRIDVTMRPVPPSLSSSSLFVFDLVPGGTLVGSVGGISNNNVLPTDNYTVRTVFSRLDTIADHFDIHPTTGEIRVKMTGANLDSLLKSSYKYDVNASDALSWNILPITITLLPSARAPLTTDQSRSVAESLLPGAFILPPLLASHPQGKSYSYSLQDPSSTFGIISTNGTLVLLNSLSFNTQVTYSLSFAVTDIDGKVATSIVTITVIETNWPPAFPSNTYKRTVNEGTLSGVGFGALITATDPNLMQVLTYSVTDCSPLFWSGLSLICPFSIDAYYGRLEVATIPNGVLLADRNASFPLSSPFSYELVITTTDPFGSKAKTNVTVTVINIVPRIETVLQPFIINADASGGTVVASLTNYVWFAPGSSPMHYTIDASNSSFTLEGDTAFNVSTLSGMLSVAIPSPRWNYNTRKDFSVIVRVADTNTSLSSSASFPVTLRHVNRRPYFVNVPSIISVPAGSSGNILSLSSFLIDDDLTLIPPISGEQMSYTLFSSLPYGNPSNTFAINNATGQVYVYNVTAFRSAYNLITGGLNYSLSISACDAGIDGPSYCSFVIVNVTAISGTIPPVITSSPIVSVPENALIGFNVTKIVAYDEAGYILTYSIVSGNIDDSFVVNNVTGWLFVSRQDVLNYETRKTYSLLISVANVFASSTISLTINIVEVNKAPSLPDVQSFSIDENSNSGTIICTAVGTDPNSADAGKLTYTIVSVSPSPPFTFFTLNRLTGVMTVASGALLNFELTSTYTVTIRVTDSAWDTVNVLGALTDDGLFVVSLNNMNDAPTIDDRRISVRENEAGVVVGSPISASDQDTAQGFIFSLSRTSLVCQSQTISTAQVNTPVFFSLSLPSTALTSSLFKVFSRIQKLSVGSVATLVIGSSASSDRYEIRMSASSTQVHRCSTSCTLLLSSSSVFVISSTPSTSTPLSNFEIEFDPSLKRVKVSSYSDGSYSSMIATMTAQDTLSMPIGSPLKVGVISSSSNTRFTSVCFMDATQAVSSLFSIDSSTGAISTVSALNYETQQEYGVEVSVKDVSTSGSAILPPGQLIEFATVIISVIDVNEAPYWTSGSLVTCPYVSTGNSYSTFIDRFPSSALYSACVYIPETALAGVISGAFISSASDYDTLWLSSNGASQSIRYSFASTPSNVFRAPDLYIFGLDAISRQISLLVNGKLIFDFETQNMLNLTAIATDYSTLPSDFSQNLKLSSSSPVAIYIQDVNEAPIITPQTCTIQEQTIFNNAPPGTLVSCNGIVNGPILASDPDTAGSTWATLSYSLTGGNSAGLFTINPSNGVISLTNAVTCCTGLAKTDSTLNFETKSIYILTVTVTDSGSLKTSANMTITLIDVNEPPVLLPSFARNVSENLLGPQVVGSPLAAYDSDLKQRLSFEIIGGNGSSVFEIDPCSGQVSILKGVSIDYETTQSFLLTIKVTDNGLAPITASLSDTRNYIITILDADDAPIFVVSSLSVTLPENSLVGATVSALITVTDQDTLGGVVSWYNQTYEILNGNTDGIFGISTTYLTLSSTQPNGAVIFVKIGGNQLLNFEDASQNNFQLLLSARDSGGKSTQGLVTITLTDVNEAPFFSSSETLIRSIDETCSSTCASRSSGLAVGSSPLSASDPDVFWSPSQTLSFSIISGGSGYFSIVSSTGQLQLTSSGAQITSLDFEVTPSYVLLVKVQDSVGSGLFSLANVTVLINNRNEPPVFNSVFGPQPGSSLTSFSRSLFENSAVGLAIGAPLLITDPEEAIGAGLLIDITAGNSLNVFSISSSGQLIVSNTLNLVYETTQSFTLTVRVKDSGKPETAQFAIEKTTTVNIAVLPVNFPPTITPDTFTISENSASGSTVMKGVSAGSAATTSADRNTLTPSFYLGANPYSILSQETTIASRTGSGGQSPFTINTATGVISVNGAVNLDFEIKSSYKVVVQVIDNGGLKANTTFTILLTNVNEAPFWRTIPTLNAIQIDLQTLSPALGPFAQDQDFNGTGNTEQLTYSIDSGNSQAIFAIDANTGQLSVIRTSMLIFGNSPVTLIIRVTDRGISGAALSATTSVTITISDNNHPPVFSQSSYTFNINENQDYNSLILPAILTSDLEWQPPTNEKVIYTLSPSGNNINRPFPFAISTIAGGTNNVNQGQLSVKWDNTAFSKLFNLDFEAPTKSSVYAVGFKTFTMTVTATDTHVPPASSIASITINLVDVPEAPYFNHATRVANSGFYRFSIPEHTPISNAVNTRAMIDLTRSINAGNQTLGGVLALDDDIADIGKLVYSLSSTTTFSISSSTGVITGGAGSTILDFETIKSYSLNVIVTDSTSTTDTATLVIDVTDVNEVATWDNTGIFDRIGSSVNSLSIFENATIGTILGSVRAVDPDSPSSTGCVGCSQRIYSLVSNAEALPFAINASTGVLTLVDPSLIDWEDKTLWQPTVAVIDSSSSPLQATKVVNVNIVDVNDVTITGLSIASQSSSVDLGETITPIPSAGGVAVLMRASGGAVIVITGTNFGLTAVRKLAEPSVTTNLVVSYGSLASGYSTYVTTNCAVTISNTEIRCTIPLGVGGGYTIKLTLYTAAPGAISPASTLSPVLVSYYKPSISSVYLSTASTSTDPATNSMSTNGGAQIVIDGRDFGPLGTSIAITYSPSTASVVRIFNGLLCSVATPDSKVQCVSSIGSGGSLTFKITVGSQVSSNFNNTVVRYASPTVTSALPLLLNTNATDNITLTGTNFGPIYPDSADLSITYSNDWLSSYPHIYTATGCIVRVPHTTIFCRNAGEGVGVSLSFIATVSGQPSVTGGSIDYKPPSITDLVSPRVFITPGGETIYINGYNFGPATLRDDLDIPLVGALFPTSRYGKTKTSSGIAISPSALSFSGVNCFVLVKHTMIQCTTNEGTGKDLAWSVTIGSQTSDSSKQLTAYAPPIVAIYGGRGNDYFAPGAHLADTTGGEPVYITGSNFGPIGSPIDSVTYGVDGNDFLGANCGFAIAHTQLLCNTTVGAGSGLKWLVTIDGQISTVPSTDYAPPIITSVSGPGSINASTDGGDIVILTGSYFSVNKWLEKVTYGPKGTEFTARNCTVTRSHTEITCTTAPGTGRKLFWTVTIRGQASSLSSTFTSYAAPTISIVQDAFGPTQGGKQIHIAGRNFGLAYAQSKITVIIDSAGYLTSVPSDEDLNAHWSSIYSGDSGLPSVTSWITNSAVSVTTILPRYISRTSASVDFILPEGYGSPINVFVLVDGVPSNRLVFGYESPQIFNLAPDRLNISGPYLNLVIEGVNFCKGAQASTSSNPSQFGCGRLFVDNLEVVSPELRTWTHGRITAKVNDPNALVPGSSASVRVEVAGRSSNAATFSTPVPAFDALTGQQNWGGGSSTVVETAIITFDLSLKGPGVTTAVVSQPKVAGPLRSSIGKSAGISTSNVELTSLTDLSTNIITLLGSSDPANTVPGSRRRLTVESGVNISLSLDVAASVQASGGSLNPSSIASMMANVSTALTSSSILTNVINAVAAAAGLNASLLSVYVDASSIKNDVATVTKAPGSANPTKGGQYFYVAGVMSIHAVPVSQISITIGGRQCTQLNKTKDGDLLIQYGIPSNSPIASQYYTYKLECYTPPGIGKDLPIIISTGPGQNSQDNPNFRFSYAPPTITSIIDAPNNVPDTTISYTTSGTVHGIPTLGRRVRILGSNFGRPELLVAPVGTAAYSSSWDLQVTLSNSQAGFLKTATLVPGFFDHDYIDVDIPTGQGANIIVSLSIGTQSDTDPLSGVSRAFTFIRYLNPSIAQVITRTGTVFGPFANSGAPTIGHTTDFPYFLQIDGSNFGTASATSGLEAGKPIVTIGGVDCPLVSLYSPNNGHSQIFCQVPEFWGKDLPVIVKISEQSSTSNIKYTYAPATISSISPSSGPTSGLRLSGTSINVTLVGTNFGREGFVQFRPVGSPYAKDPFAANITVPHSAMFVHNHTHMIFAMPEGAGYDLRVVASIGGQESITTDKTFTYDPPSISLIKSPTRSIADCSPRVALMRIGTGNKTMIVNRTIYPTYPGCYPTLNDPAYLVEVNGESFGASFIQISITIGGKVCTVSSHTHTQAWCYAPSGMGDRNNVFITVGGRSNILTSASNYAYDPPTVGSIMPNRADAGVGQAIEIHGHNFGPIENPVVIVVGGKPCLTRTSDEDGLELPPLPARWISDDFLKCSTVPDVVGPKNLTILAANRSEPIVWLEIENFIELRCTKGFYGLRDEVCLECGNEPGQQPGAKCPGGELDDDLAVSLPGWYRFNTTETAQCNPLRAQRALPGGPGCPVFVACEPLESCLGANRCAVQYSNCPWVYQDANNNYRCQEPVSSIPDYGRCAYCANRFYRVNGECIKCPDSPWATVVVFLVIALLAMFTAHQLNNKNINLALISIGTDWAQVVAMFARTRIAWPQLVKDLFLLLSAFNFNLELIAPECAIPNVTYAGKWLFVEGMPLFAWSVLIMVFLWRSFVKVCILGVEKKKRYNHAHVVVATGVVVQRVLYLYMTRSTLDVFNCSPTDPPDYDKEGKMILYMAWNLSIKCNEPGGTHLWLLPFAIVALAIYVVGMPVLSLWWLWKNKTVIKYDQILRAQIAGDDKATNPHYAFRRTYKALYMNYRPGSWFWEFIICIRKFLIAFCSLMFRATPSFQLAMALLVIFIAYVLQVRSLPYLSHAKAVEAYREHNVKVLEGNSIHTRIDNEMKARAAYYARGMAGGKAASLSEVEKKKTQKVFVTGGGVSESPLETFYASRRSTFENQLREGRATILRNKVASFIFDYNTAEAVLLASCLLINLAGICFDSSRFSASVINMPGRKAEYDSLAFAVICVIFISLIFWIISLGTDVALVLSPQAVNSCLGGLGKARKGLVAQAQKSMKMGKASSTKRSSSKTEALEFFKKDPNEVQFETNFVLLKGGVRAESGGDSRDVQELQRIIQELREQRNADSLAMQDMQAQLEEVKDNSTAKNGIRLAMKKSFTPVDVSEVDNPLKNVLTNADGSVLSFKRGVDDNSATLPLVDANVVQQTKIKFEQIKVKQNQIETSKSEKESQREMMKSKMKVKATEKMKEAETAEDEI